MENINEIDFEIIKEFINLPLDSLKQYIDTVTGKNTHVEFTETAVIPVSSAGVADGSIGISVDCAGGISGTLMYFVSYGDAEKFVRLKDNKAFEAVAEDDQYEYVMEGSRAFIQEISESLSNSYKMLLECDISIGTVSAFTVPKASDFYNDRFGADTEATIINGVLSDDSEQTIEFKIIIDAAMAKNITEVFYNNDIKLPSQMPSLGESVAESHDGADAFAGGSGNMADFINGELNMMSMPEEDSSFADAMPMMNSETPISEKVEHIKAPKGGNLDLIMSVPVEVSVEVGRTKKRIKEILDFKKGTLIELDRTAGEPMDIFVNGKCIAKGEVVVIEDKFGVRITRILKTNNLFD